MKPGAVSILVCALLALGCGGRFHGTDDDGESDSPWDTAAEQDVTGDAEDPDGDACPPERLCPDGACIEEDECCEASDCGPGNWMCGVDHACFCARAPCVDGFCPTDVDCCDADECGPGAWECPTDHECECALDACTADGFCPATGECCTGVDCGGGSWSCVDHACGCDGYACAGDCHPGWVCCPGDPGGACIRCGTYICNTSGAFDCTGQHGNCDWPGSVMCTCPPCDGLCTGCASGQRIECGSDCVITGCFP